MAAHRRSIKPSAFDFPLADEIFPDASFQSVWYGMGGAVPAQLQRASEAALGRLAQIRQRERGLLSALPANRALLERVAAGDRERALHR